MCLIFIWNWRIFAIEIVLWLLSKMIVTLGSFFSSSIWDREDCNQMASLVAGVYAKYLALQIQKNTVSYCFKDQIMAAFLILKKNSDIDLWVSISLIHFGSMYPTSCLSLSWKIKSIQVVLLRYWMIYITALTLAEPEMVRHWLSKATKKAMSTCVLSILYIWGLIVCEYNFLSWTLQKYFFSRVFNYLVFIEVWPSKYQNCRALFWHIYIVLAIMLVVVDCKLQVFWSDNGICHNYSFWIAYWKLVQFLWFGWLMAPKSTCRQ